MCACVVRCVSQCDSVCWILGACELADLPCVLASCVRARDADEGDGNDNSDQNKAATRIVIVMVTVVCMATTGMHAT